MSSRVSIEVLTSPLLCDGDSTKWRSFEVLASSRIIVYPPYASGGPGRPIHPTLNVPKALQRISEKGGELKGIPPQRTFISATVEPTTTNGIVFYPVGIRNDDIIGMFPSETMALEVFGEVDASVYLQRAFIHLRRYTRQVWVGHTQLVIEPTTGCIFSMSPDRIAHSAIHLCGDQKVGLFHSTRLCTQEIWQAAWGETLSEPIPLCVDIVH